jgi:hypothetical protein
MITPGSQGKVSLAIVLHVALPPPLFRRRQDEQRVCQHRHGVKSRIVVKFFGGNNDI